MRVVQDSDDESGGDIELELSQPGVDASPKLPTNSASADQSEGSTESLKRTIETAHRDHFQSNRRDPHSSLSLPEPEGKRMRLSDDTTFLESRGVRDRNGAAGTIATNSSTSLTEERTASKPILEELESTMEGTWMPEGTLRRDYAQHEPVEMFPEPLFPDPSSTVPNATLTQQRIMDAADVASYGMGNGYEEGQFHPQPSIPWSEFVTTSPADNSHGQPLSDQQRQTSEIASAISLVPELQKTQETCTSQWSQQSLSLVGDVPSVDKSPTQIKGAHNDVDSCEVVMHSQDTKFRKESDQRAPASSKSHRNSQNQHSTQHRDSPKVLKDSAPSSDDDLADMDLPAEQYKPRPSRSRSLKVGSQKDVDYSVRPEKVARASKRRKTTPVDASIHEPSVSTPQRIQQICDMGFTPSTTKKALKRNNGDVTQTVDWLIARELTADELASPNRSRGKSTASTINDQRLGTEFDDIQKGSDVHAQDCTSEHTDGPAISEMINGVSTTATQDTMNNNPVLLSPDVQSLAPEVRSPVKVQVVIPTKPTEPVPQNTSSLQAPSRKAKRRKTTLDQPEAVLSNEDGVKSVPEKKRGRGRPKKSVITTTSMEITQQDEQKKPPDSTLEVIEAEEAKTTVHPGASGAAVPLPCEAAPTTTTSIATPETPPLPIRPEVSPITPERTNKSAKRDQSVSSQGKVPYRVGLSKRARIAPLLRTMRK